MQRSASSLVSAAAALAVAFASPAIAKPRSQAGAASQRVSNPVAAAAHNPNCVYSSGGNLIGCDPDPNIRQQLQTSAYRNGPTS